jgi:hypothetical protein
MTLESDFNKMQYAYNTLIYHYTRLTVKKVKGESSEVRKALSVIQGLAKDMRKSTQEYKEKM